MSTALYLRQSKDQNGTGLAIDRQRQDCLKLCDQKGYRDPVEYVDNDVSASTGKVRPAYARMLGDIEAGTIGAVVCWDLDRLHRRPIELEYFIELADRHNLALASVSGDHDLGTGDGRMFARIKGAVAREEMDQKAKRQRRQAKQRAELGLPHVAGPRAFGYESDGMTVREDEAEALREAYQSVLEGRSLVSICVDLNKTGFTTPAGKEFRNSGLRAMLLNYRNIATRTYSTRGPDRKLRTEVVGAAKWPAIIDREVFESVRGILEDPARRKNHGTARQWLGGSLYLCGRCGSDVRVNYRERDRNGAPVRVYRCRQSAHLSRTASWVDWRVEEHVIARLSRDDARELLVDDRTENVNDLRRQADLLRMRLEQLGEDFADGMITRETMKSGSERLRQRLADLDDRMTHVDRGPILADLITSGDVRAMWKAIGLDRQRAVINLLYKVILLPRPPGRYETPIESVIMEPRI
jgi:DNA invertase Pin-like site-specific DNA recombinase